MRFAFRLFPLPSETSPYPRLPALGLFIFGLCGALCGFAFSVNNPLLPLSLAAICALPVLFLTSNADKRSAPVASSLIWASVFFIFLALPAVFADKPLPRFYSGLYAVSGVVCDISGDDRYTLLRLSSPEIGGHKLDYPLDLFLAGERNVQVAPGCVISGHCSVEVSSNRISATPLGVMRVEQTTEWGLTTSLTALRAEVARQFHTHLDRYSAGLAEAVALGSRGNLDEEWRIAFVQSGNAHLLAVSGMHVGIITALAFFLAAMFGLSRGARFTCAAIATAVFLALVGFNPPAVRASLAVAALCVGVAYGRPSLALNSLAFAALLILAYDPSAVFGASFQLSFAATAGILILGIPLSKLIPSLLPLATKREIFLHYLKKSALVSLGAWAFATPFIWYHFGMVTPFSFLAALPAVPILTALVPTCLLMAGLSIISGGALLLTAPVQLFAHSLAALNKLISLVPLGFSVTQPAPILAVILWVVILFIAALLLFDLRLKLCAAILALLPLLAFFGSACSMNGIFSLPNYPNAIAVSSPGSTVIFTSKAIPEWRLRYAVNSLKLPPPSIFVMTSYSRPHSDINSGARWLVPSFEQNGEHTGYGEGFEFRVGDTVFTALAPKYAPWADHGGGCLSIPRWRVQLSGGQTTILISP